MHIRITFSLVMVMACVASHGIHCNVLTSQMERLDGILSELEENFNQAKVSFHESKQHLNRTEDMCLVEHGVYIEMTRYAILRKSVMALKVDLSKRFSVDPDSGDLVDSRHTLRGLIIPSLISRLLVRAYADAKSYTESLLDILLKMIKNMNIRKNDDEEKRDENMARAVEAINNLLEKFKGSFETHLAEYETNLSELEEPDQNEAIKLLWRNSILRVLDRTIDEIMDCHNCSSQGKRFGYEEDPIFSSVKQVHNALDEVDDGFSKELVGCE